MISIQNKYFQPINLLGALYLILVTGCLTSTQQEDLIPDHTSFTVDSKQIGEKRTINVWTPVDYTSDTVALPVLYMADGGIHEDFPHVANTLSKLIQEGKIHPLILVGIENTERKRDLTGFTEVAKDKEIGSVVGGSTRFREFIKLELFPEIQKRYRTTNLKSIIGESAAGLFVIETFLLSPGMFDYYIAFDPSLWWNNQYLVKTAQVHLSKFQGMEKRLWFAGSNTSDISPYTNQLAKILQSTDSSGIKWHYAYKPNEKHNTIFRSTKDEALIWTFSSIH